MIAIIDYGMGNVKSLSNAVDYLGLNAIVTDDKTKINSASHLLLPGVGAFGDAMKKLNRSDLIQILNQQVFEKGKPILGICLGMQIFARSSTEHGFNEGLGWLDAEVVRFKFNSNKIKIPHMGWNKINIIVEEPLFQHLGNNKTFYFVHSYFMKCNNEANIAATCYYGNNFTSSVKSDNILGTQFHPEKSQDNGIQVLKNFLLWNP